MNPSSHPVLYNKTILKESSPSSAPAPFRVELLGGLRLVLPGGSTVSRFRTQKTATLLAFLALHAGRMHAREQLLELFWPDLDEPSGRNNLSTTLSFLRRDLAEPATALGPSAEFPLLADHRAVGFAETVQTDVAEWNRLLTLALGRQSISPPPPQTAQGAQGGATELTGQREWLEAALLLHRGPFLPGFYDTWICDEQNRFDEQYIRVLQVLIGLREQSHETEAALDLARRGLLADPYAEDFCHAALRCFAVLNQFSPALDLFDLWEKRLQTETNSPPSANLLALVKHIRTQVIHDPARLGMMGAAVQDTALRFPASAVSEVLEAADAALSFPSDGPLAFDSPLYVDRDADAVVRRAVKKGEGVILIKGARESGKTSLLARGLHDARHASRRVVLTDLSLVGGEARQSADRFFQTLAADMGEQLNLSGETAAYLNKRWDVMRVPTMNFELFLRRVVLESLPSAAPLTWVWDEADVLSDCFFGDDVWALLRSWYNRRALDPDGPWGKLSLLIAYATEAHLLVSNLNQSPFNIGLRVSLESFSLEQTIHLACRMNPARYFAPDAAGAFHLLTGGQPHLVRLGLAALLQTPCKLQNVRDLHQQARQNGGPWKRPLQRLRETLRRSPVLWKAAQVCASGKPCPTFEAFYRLRAAGFLRGGSPDAASLSAELYYCLFSASSETE